MTELLAGPMGIFVYLLPMVVLFYFLMIRPQQKQMKAHQALIAGLKRGDTVVMSNGMVGKITRVETEEVMVEIAQGVNVRVIKSMITTVRDRTEVAVANDTRPAKPAAKTAAKPSAKA